MKWFPRFLNYVTPGQRCRGHQRTVPGDYAELASCLRPTHRARPAININDYISTGNNRKAPNNFSPRLGFSYDINGDNRW